MARFVMTAGAFSNISYRLTRTLETIPDDEWDAMPKEDKEEFLLEMDTYAQEEVLHDIDWVIEVEPDCG